MIHKFYERFTTDKRIHLIINAVLQGNYEEVERLEQGSQEFLIGAERHAWVIVRIFLFVGAQLLQNYGQCQILAGLQEQYANRQEVSPQGETVWWQLADEMAKAKNISISHAQAIWEGFNEFWKIKNISPDPPENYLRVILPGFLDLWLAETKGMFDRSLVRPEEVAETVEILNKLWVWFGGDFFGKKTDEHGPLSFPDL